MAASTERTFPALAPRVPSEFRASLLQIPLFGDENLLIQGANIHPTTPATVVVVGRLWSDARREIVMFREQVDLPAGGATTNKFSVLERGALLSVRVSMDTVAVPHGNTWTRVLLMKGFTGELTFGSCVVQGYPSFFNDIAWPGSPIQTVLDGPGVIRYLPFVQFSPSILTVTVPTHRRWRVLTCVVVLITDANLGARLVQVEVVHAGSTVFGADASPTQANNQTRGYSLIPGLNASAVVPTIYQGLPFVPDLELVAGDVLQIRADQGAIFSAGDLFAGQVLTVREWFDPQ